MTPPSFPPRLAKEEFYHVRIPGPTPATNFETLLTTLLWTPLWGWTPRTVPTTEHPAGYGRCPKAESYNKPSSAHPLRPEVRPQTPVGRNPRFRRALRHQSPSPGPGRIDAKAPAKDSTSTDVKHPKNQGPFETCAKPQGRPLLHPGPKRMDV